MADHYAARLMRIFCVVGLCLWSSQGTAQIIIGNGGDAIRFVFADAAEQAAIVLRDLPAGDDFDENEYARWLWAHKAQLQEKVSTSEHVWGDTLPQGCPVDSCACVLQDQLSKIYLATDSCKASTRKVEDAGRLVVHEAVHQLGVLDEQFADRVARLVYHRWNTLNARVGSWQTLSVNRAVRGAYEASSAWSGRHLFIWGGVGAIGASRAGAIYDSENGTWRATAESHLVPRKQPRIEWADGYFVVFGGEFVPLFTPDNAFGALYNAERDTWQPISQINAPSRAEHGVEVLTPHGLFVWGGKIRGASRLSYDVRILDLARNQWRNGAPTLDSDARYRAASVWTGKEVMIFGGKKTFGHGAIDLSGLAYDPVADSWRKINAPHVENDLNALSHVEALYVQGQVFIFGIDYADNFTLLGRYVPEFDYWLPAKQLNDSPVFPLRHRLLATSSKIVALGDIKSGQSAVFDVATGSWQLLAKNSLVLGYNLHQFAATATNDGILVWGGKASGLTDADAFRQLREGFEWRPHW